MAIFSASDCEWISFWFVVDLLHLDSSRQCTAVLHAPDYTHQIFKTQRSTNRLDYASMFACNWRRSDPLSPLSSAVWMLTCHHVCSWGMTLLAARLLQFRLPALGISHECSCVSHLTGTTAKLSDATPTVVKRRAAFWALKSRFIEMLSTHKTCHASAEMRCAIDRFTSRMTLYGFCVKTWPGLHRYSHSMCTPSYSKEHRLCGR